MVRFVTSPAPYLFAIPLVVTSLIASSSRPAPSAAPGMGRPVADDATPTQPLPGLARLAPTPGAPVLGARQVLDALGLRQASAPAPLSPRGGARPSYPMGARKGAPGPPAAWVVVHLLPVEVAFVAASPGCVACPFPW